MTDHYRMNAAQRERRRRENAPALARHMQRQAEETARLETLSRMGGSRMTTQTEVRKNVEAMESVVPETIKLLKGYRSKAAAVYRNLDLPDAAKAARAVAARDEALESLNELRETLNASHEAVKEGVVEMEAKHNQHPDRTSAAAESRLTRAWQRTMRLLDAGENVHTVMGGAADNGDAATLHALYEEAPAYFTANGKRQEGEKVKAKARDLRGTVEGGLLGEALAAEHIAAEAADWAVAPLRDATNELEGGKPVKRVWQKGGDIEQMTDTTDIAERVRSDSITHASAIREASHG